MHTQSTHVLWFEEIGRADVSRVGGKNASLGEIIRSLGGKGIKVPPGFATTAEAYWQYVEANGLRRVIADSLKAFDAGHAPLAEIGATIRHEFLRGTWPKDLAEAIQSAYRQLCWRENVQNRPDNENINIDVAVRSSATAEDLPDASFAGQQESYLNIRGEVALLDACRRCYASLFTDRAISYRRAKGFDDIKVALSIGVQRMVRADLSGAGVMFSIDTETGFDKVVLINAAWGLGENVVQGAVDPDEYEVFKPFLSNAGVTPIIEKKLGEKSRKMIYTSDADHPTRNVPTSRAERTAFVLGAQTFSHSRAGRAPSKATMGARWISNGPRMAKPASCSLSRRAPKRSNRAGKRVHSKPTGSNRWAESSLRASVSVRRLWPAAPV